VERRGWLVGNVDSFNRGESPGRRRSSMPGPDEKSFAIPELLVWEAWRQVKANKGALGVDRRALDEFEADPEGQPRQGLESDEFGVLLSAPGEGG
jgi:hypothetical protein